MDIAVGSEGHGQDETTSIYIPRAEPKGAQSGRMADARHKSHPETQTPI